MIILNSTNLIMILLIVLMAIVPINCFVLNDHVNATSSPNEYSMLYLVNLMVEEKVSRIRLESMIENLTKELKQLEGSVTNFYNEVTENTTIFTAKMNRKYNEINNRLDHILSIGGKPNWNDSGFESRIKDVENKIKDLDHNVTVAMKENESYLKTDMHNLEHAMQTIQGEIGHLNKSFEENIKSAIHSNGVLNATLEVQSNKLEMVIENITMIQERFLFPTTLFSAYGVEDTSPARNQTIVFPNVTINIGNGYNETNGFFTAPVNGTYLFSMQVCTTKNNWGWFQLVVSSSTGSTIILAMSHYNSITAGSTNSDSVAYFLRAGEKVWVQSYENSGKTLTLYFNEQTCWNHFSGVLVNN